ncbi:hypothetical protein [Laspinema olomoucense]|uniref:hypothetical protein n=1 Tax=Laspinema olomoucense TaxID=3231600 RepID=UPI0021BAA1E8|nr:hypothetical protein [Laspinema sp. D3a]MCT7991054.1 hypothetical protein [Laspinema sp. D3a]
MISSNFLKSFPPRNFMCKLVIAGVMYLTPVSMLQLGIGIVIPAILSPISAQESPSQLNAMLEELGRRETRDQPGSPYQVTNHLGFIGKYQFGEALLIDLGYYIPKNCTWYNQGANTNEWHGTWARGIRDVNDFKENGARWQEQAIREAFGLTWHYLTSQLGSDKLHSLLQEKNISIAGIVAGSHLVGYEAAIAYLTRGEVATDPNNTAITDYIEEFKHFQITPEDFGGSRPPQRIECN